MIEVTITGEQALDEMGKHEWSGHTTFGVRLACVMREILYDAGIPLESTFDPMCDPRVRRGRLEWHEDRLTDMKVFRWYPDAADTTTP